MPERNHGASPCLLPLGESLRGQTGRQFRKTLLFLGTIQLFSDRAKNKSGKDQLGRFLGY